MVTLSTSSFYIRQELNSMRKTKALQSKSGQSLIRYHGKNRRNIYDKDNKIQIIKSMKNIDVGQPNSYYKRKGLRK